MAKSVCLTTNLVLLLIASTARAGSRESNGAPGATNLVGSDAAPPVVTTPPAASPSPVASPVIPAPQSNDTETPVAKEPRPTDEPAPAPDLPVAFLPPPPPDPNAHQREGFFLRLRAGPGADFATRTGAETTLHLSGYGGGFAVSVGYVIARNVILYGELYDAFLQIPISSDIGTASGGIADGFGPGIAYYFGESNIYLAACAGLALIRFDPDLLPLTLGFASNVSLGKEWWASGHWTLGIGAELAYGRATTSDEKWTTATATFLFSATYY